MTAVQSAVAPSVTMPADYKQKEEVWFDDGREERLLAYVQSQLQSTSTTTTTNRPDEVIRLIDHFGAQQNYMMNVGARKGAIVTDLIAAHTPSTMLELGSYIGYSTILFASALRANGGKQYVSFERDAKFARIAAALVELAGLADVVRFVVGPSSSGLVHEFAAGRLAGGGVDMVFLDHYKPAYVRDLKILESLGALRVGSVLAADNVIEPGNPTYLEYVRSSPEQKMERAKRQEKEEGKGFPEKTVNQYKRQYEVDETEMAGVPGIVYESRIVHSHEPTGVPDGIEITVCKSIPS